jgi:hypothetical protein
MSSNVIRVATYYDAVEAEFARGRLAEARIKSFLGSEATGNLFPGLSGSLGRFDLHVAEEDLERTNEGS